MALATFVALLQGQREQAGKTAMWEHNVQFQDAKAELTFKEKIRHGKTLTVARKKSSCGPHTRNETAKKAGPARVRATLILSPMTSNSLVTFLQFACFSVVFSTCHTHPLSTAL